VAVAGLGLAAEASSESPEEAAEALGLEGLVTSSIASAANSSSRWYALAIGVPVLVWTTRGLLRALIGAHRLVWGDVRARALKPGLLPTLLLLGVLLSFGVVSALASALRAWETGPGVLGSLVALVPYAGLWLLVSLRLPHRDAPWSALLPGALVFGAGIQLLNAVIAYVITPWALAKHGTYGALGVAAALLFGLYLISRLVVGVAVLNATLWDRRSAASR
jgi:membrane protein